MKADEKRILVFNGRILGSIWTTKSRLAMAKKKEALTVNEISKLLNRWAGHLSRLMVWEMRLNRKVYTRINCLTYNAC